MKKINIYPDNFAGGKGVTNKTPKHFEWDFNSKKNDISFYVDGGFRQGIEDTNDKKLKFLWTVESPYFNSEVFKYIKNNLDQILSTFELIFTYNEELLDLHEKFKMVPANGTWIQESEIYKKTKLVSMIVSNKVGTPNQNFRYEFAKNNVKNIDIFGRGFNEIPKKEIGLNDYMFSVCVENATFDGYFTEKILDCFATGTIPIYLGSKKITKHFDENGIIFLDDFDFSKLNAELYQSKIDSIHKNYNECMKFVCPEDFMYDNYLNKYF